jgi:hypothetical protein
VSVPSFDGDGRVSFFLMRLWKTETMTDVILPEGAYSDTLADVVELLEEGRRTAARSINALMTATYWLVGRRIVESEQGGQGRAAYGQAILQRLSADLTRQFGRGFGADNLELMRLFYQSYPPGEISESVIRKSRTTGSDFFASAAGGTLPVVLDTLRAADATDAFARRADVLRNGTVARGLERATARTPDGQSVLHAHVAVQR